MVQPIAKEGQSWRLKFYADVETGRLSAKEFQEKMDLCNCFEMIKIKNSIKMIGTGKISPYQWEIACMDCGRLYRVKESEIYNFFDCVAT